MVYGCLWHLSLKLLGFVNNKQPPLTGVPRRGHNVQGIEATANGDIIGQSYENHNLSKIIRFNGSNNLYFAGHKFLAKYT